MTQPAPDPSGPASDNILPFPVPEIPENEPIRRVFYQPSETFTPLPAEEYLVLAKDQQGHAETVRLQVMPGYMGEIARMVARGAAPWGTPADFIRYAIARTLTEVVENGWSDGTVAVTLNKIQAVLRDDNDHRALLEAFPFLMETFKKHRRDGQPEMGRALLEGVAEQIENMPEGDWKLKYKGRFDEWFGELLQ